MIGLVGLGEGIGRVGMVVEGIVMVEGIAMVEGAMEGIEEDPGGIAEVRLLHLAKMIRTPKKGILGCSRARS